jgi:hypothetical protein
MRKCIYLQEPADFFVDRQCYNGFVRVRRDHLERLGLAKNQQIEIDFYDFDAWFEQRKKQLKKYSDDQIPLETGMKEKEVLFEFSGSQKEDLGTYSDVFEAKDVDEYLKSVVLKNN